MHKIVKINKKEKRGKKKRIGNGYYREISIFPCRKGFVEFALNRGSWVGNKETIEENNEND